MSARRCLPLLCAALLCTCHRQPATEITAGPYLLHVGTADATIAWLTSAPADTTVECSAGEALPTTHADERTTVHQAHLDRLAPDTAYHYRVSSGAARSAIHEFRTAPREPRAFRFVVLGSTGEAPERLAQLAEAVRKRQPAFVVHTGSFLAGTRSDEQWAQRFFRPARELLAACALVPVPGPREGEGFDRLFPTGSGAPWRSYRYLHVEIFALDLRRGIAVGDEQYRWLEGALARSDAQWKVVALHGALFPGTAAAVRPDLRRVLYPLLLRCRADLTVAGGAMRYARTLPIGAGEKPEHNAIVNVVAAAHAALPADPPGEPWLARVSARGSYLLVEADGEELTVQAIDSDGATLDAVTLQKAGSLRQRRGALSAEALEGLFAFLPPKGVRVEPGDTPLRLTVTVENPYPAPIDGMVHWQAPNRAWTVEPSSLALSVPPFGHQRCVVSVTARPPGLATPPTPAFVAAGLRLESRASPFHVERAGQ